MRRCALLLFAAALAVAQTPAPSPAPTPDPFPNQWIGGYVDYNQFNTPALSGGVVYAQLVLSGTHPTYSYNSVHITSVNSHPFQVMATVEPGAAQHIKQVAGFDIYLLGQLGLATARSNVGFSATGGGFAQRRLKGNWTIGPEIRITKTTISAKQWSAGLMLGWGE